MSFYDFYVYPPFFEEVFSSVYFLSLKYFLFLLCAFLLLNLFIVAKKIVFWAVFLFYSFMQACLYTCFLLFLSSWKYSSFTCLHLFLYSVLYSVPFIVIGCCLFFIKSWISSNIHSFDSCLYFQGIITCVNITRISLKLFHF